MCVVVVDGGRNTDGVALVVVATNGRVDCVVMSVDVRISGYVLLQHAPDDKTSHRKQERNRLCVG